MPIKKAVAKRTAKKSAPKKVEPKLEESPAGLIPSEQAPDGKPVDVEVAALTADQGDAHAVLHLDGKQYRLGGEIVNALRRAFEAAHSIVNPGH